MTGFISGALVAGYCVAALFFLRFWTRSRDRLFLYFAFAFALLSLQRGLLALVASPATATALYGLRLLAFLIILYAIWDKNADKRP